MKWSPIGLEIVKDGSSDDGDIDEEVKKEIKPGNGIENATILETICEADEVPVPDTPSRPSSAASGKKKGKKRRNRDYDWNTKAKKRRITSRKSNAKYKHFFTSCL